MSDEPTLETFLERIKVLEAVPADTMLLIGDVIVPVRAGESQHEAVLRQIREEPARHAIIRELKRGALSTQVWRGPAVETFQSKSLGGWRRPSAPQESNEVLNRMEYNSILKTATNAAGRQT